MVLLPSTRGNANLLGQAKGCAVAHQEALPEQVLPELGGAAYGEDEKLGWGRHRRKSQFFQPVEQEDFFITELGKGGLVIWFIAQGGETGGLGQGIDVPGRARL